ncbi:hypothetical protein GCM10023080_044690 [Streptomyces pseudoechinosporeus]
MGDRGIALLGGDGDSDVRPSPVDGVHSPVHALTVAAMGMPLPDNLDLEALSAATAEAGRYEFLAGRGAAERSGRDRIARQSGRGPVMTRPQLVTVREKNRAHYGLSHH